MSQSILKLGHRMPFIITDLFLYYQTEKLMSYIESYKLLHRKQNGFRTGHSTESALTQITDPWLKAINNGNLVGCIMVDFRKAFDLVDHHLLLQKVRLYRLSELSLSWFDSYPTS